MGSSSCGEMKLFNHSHGQSSQNNQGEEDGLYNQLWLACAGPLANVPRVGDKVYYFPQGHLEQVEAYMKQDGPVEMPIYNLPSKILCKVVYVHLKAEANTDEVFAQITLLPENEDQLSNEEARSSSPPQESRARSFSKRLTPSDTSTHGGFSVPKKYADDFFPPLDMSQETPSEELVAKDLHGSPWHFRHIYRGQPKRHLLTSGWSVFVSTKKLVAGDTAIFLRGENGEVYVGVRRARKLENTASVSVLSSISMRHGILATAFHAMTTGSMFTVYYRPWTDPGQFLVSYDQYMKSAEIHYSFGTRFRMQCESLEWPEYMNQNFTGTVIGSEDIDCIRWPDSEWRQLKVRWDAASDFRMLPVRVSPWNVEPVGVTKKKSISLSSHPKRPRPLDTADILFIVKNGMLKSPVGRTNQRHSGVLQGQEINAVGPHELDASAQPNGNNKFMLFGVDLLNTTHSGLPSQMISSSEISSLCNGPSSVSQSPISKTKCNNSVTNRSCTKVLKYGTALGRSIDLTHFKEYKELIYELDHMFDLKGTLVDGSSGWHVTYANGKGDVLPLGDCPWPEFRAMVRKMYICPDEDGDRVDLIS